MMRGIIIRIFYERVSGTVMSMPTKTELSDRSRGYDELDCSFLATSLAERGAVTSEGV